MLCKQTKPYAAIPHAALDDDFYEGYRIPKGMSRFLCFAAELHDGAYSCDGCGECLVCQ